MANDAVKNSRDWLLSPRTNLLAWRLSQIAIGLALFVPAPIVP